MKRNLAIALILSLGISGLSGLSVQAEESEAPVMHQAMESTFLEDQPENLEVSEQEIQENGREGEMPGHWVLNASGWWYAYEDGTWPSDGMVTIDGTDYAFNSAGYMITGWYLSAEGWYYMTGSGAKAVGWQNIGGAWYYLDGENTEHPGLMVGTGWHLIQGQWYYMTESGAMAADWLLSSEGWYYLGRDGAMKTGWQLVGGVWYYLNGTEEEHPGVMAADCKKVIGKDTYFFAVSGAMHTGWVLRPEGWYYLGGDGVMKTGWQLVGGAWYYLDGENSEYPGLMTGAGWHLIQGQKYYMTGSGAMATDWLLGSEGWYYLGGDGAMKTGWQWIDNHWYYFYTENDPLGGTTGVMAVNTMVDGWTITSNGIAVNGLEGKFEEIKKYVYVPYRYGGTTPSGWDCSGFTQWALHYIGGITIPRTTYLQAAGGVNIDKNNRNLWKPGDILVYQSGSGFSHVALYLGDGMLMHALNTKYGTLIQGVDYYEQWDRGNHLALVRRYL